MDSFESSESLWIWAVGTTIEKIRCNAAVTTRQVPGGPKYREHENDSLPPLSREKRDTRVIGELSMGCLAFFQAEYIHLLLPSFAAALHFVQRSSRFCCGVK
jgi:hypothetical protein